MCCLAADEPTSPGVPSDVDCISTVESPHGLCGRWVAAWQACVGNRGAAAGMQQQGPCRTCVCACASAFARVYVRAVGSRVRDVCFSAGHETSLPAR